MCASRHARVQAAMEALHSEPNSLARSLTTKQTGLLALLLTDIANPFSAQIARGVQDVAEAASYDPSSAAPTTHAARRGWCDDRLRRVFHAASYAGCARWPPLPAGAA